MNQVTNLLQKLAKAKTATEKRSIRIRLRKLGHIGGTRGKVVEPKPKKELTKKQKESIGKHNDEVTRRIKSGEYRVDFSNTGGSNKKTCWNCQKYKSCRRSLKKNNINPKDPSNEAIKLCSVWRLNKERSKANGK